jgi:biopolymer transport protein ExbD
MKRQQARKNAKAASLNMISLMDIFTILVFFLLVNATSAQVLPSQKDITLPNSSSDKLPLQNLVIAVDEKIIRLQGQPVIAIDDIEESNSTIRPLFEALRARAKIKDKNILDRKGVTIMGDKKIPFHLLKKIMLTCAGAEYTNISFAVNQKPPSSDS